MTERAQIALMLREVFGDLSFGWGVVFRLDRDGNVVLRARK